VRLDQTKQIRRRRGNPPLLISLDRDGEPLFRQIYRSIRGAILSGRLAGGTRLPATRTLAADLEVARTTVVLAFEQLVTEGFVHGRGSAGTFVSELTLPRALPRPQPAREPEAPPPNQPSAAVTTAIPSPLPFRVGEPALELFPKATWSRLCARHARSSGTDLLGYGDANGFRPLQRAIAEYTAASRGVRATADQVILNRGAQQAIDLIARVLLRPGDQVWFEDPGYPASRRLLELTGAKTVPIPLDGDGLIVEAGTRQAPDAKLAYVAPSHQFPLGSAMSLARRLALLDWAARANAWIVEDDYDSEFRYPGRPVASLQGLDRADRVIYVGTFSKTVFRRVAHRGRSSLPDGGTSCAGRLHRRGPLHAPHSSHARGVRRAARGAARRRPPRDGRAHDGRAGRLGHARDRVAAPRRGRPTGVASRA
jgi:GntR family transcriptional regulator/MocR family aminotransferase